MKLHSNKTLLPWRFSALGLLLLAAASLGLAGCPELPEDGNYEEGFDDGFAEDEEYWQGYYDSWDTVDGGEIYYTGHEIPYIEEDTYEAGYWDGVWYAYNDGYFVAYDYAFTIGFSDGYDAAYQPEWDNFILNDEHIEWLDGGFSDGYNDGFSEGRVFGADDWEFPRDFDWMDAMLDYRDGIDVLLDDYGVEVGTGEWGPVYLYEYGANPWELIEGKSGDVARKNRAGADKPAIRRGTDQKVTINEVSYRPLQEEVRQELDVRYNKAPRGDIELSIQDKWLDRIQQYLSVYEDGSKAERVPTRSGVTPEQQQAK